MMNGSDCAISCTKGSKCPIMISEADLWAPNGWLFARPPPWSITAGALPAARAVRLAAGWLAGQLAGAPVAQAVCSLPLQLRPADG